MTRVCIINVVGLTPRLLAHAPRIASVGTASAWQSPLPAVTCTSQATMLTGMAPRDHGIVGNGWYFRDTQEVRFWQQANSLIQGPKFYDGVETAKMFWWFNQSSGVQYSATPKPHYGCDGSKAFDILDHTGCELTKKLGPFPFFSFWGPGAGLPSSDWIADATAIVMRQKQPQLTLAYLPHLDYDFQRLPHHDPARVAEVDAAAGRIIDAADAIGARVVVVSEYGLVPVQRPVSINRVLRKAGWLGIRNGPFGEMLIPGESAAFAVADHQLAHVYVRDRSMIPDVQSALLATPGIAQVVAPETIGLDHPRSGELIALADSDAWFTYYYWLDEARAPDFARTVDIHRKPGYDPCELFMTSKVRIAARLAQKKLGFRYKMDVIPLDANLVRGSHGIHPESPDDGPVIVGPPTTDSRDAESHTSTASDATNNSISLPTDMQDFAAYVKSLLATEPPKGGN
ncbi:Type I phosphodiesterase / nucleotide pyrophosphatase [Rubripirellula lacrimiformis]|uniref:Type I phosphodiesterase / nucleotide pyrophosphatase n=1 Tax=Rubripirellula lacrimiformis TaxID=1930273 RepID=A0A517N5P7_9BACT|nr:nucleotide pyrophosphatase/phosphodiesterase family protein [Rubripirellula lacrimiformis]QDT02433.1 Type I phosphodiesterase / nucleotide pyrophosphatase [Rubripirellula lacrimiformis]